MNKINSIINRNNIISATKFILKRKRNNNLEIMSTFPLLWHIFKFYLFKIIDFLYNFVYNFFDDAKKIKYANNNRKLVAKIHFLFGLDAIKNNKLTDAKMRFWLASKFMPNSPTLYYHFGYLEYLRGNIKQTAIWLSKIKGTKKYNTHRVQDLINRINKTNYDIIRKLNILF